MTDPLTMLVVAACGLAATMILALAALKGWHGWLALQHATLAGGRAPLADELSPGQRIELADLRERVRKLEAIAAGVDL